MKHEMKPVVNIRDVLFTKGSIGNRIVLRNILIEVVNLDTSIFIMKGSLEKEEHLLCAEYINSSFSKEIENRETESIETDRNRMYIYDMNRDSSDRYGRLSDSLRSKIEGYAHGLVSIIRYIQQETMEGNEVQQKMMETTESIESKENDLLFFCIMEVFEEFVLGLHTVYSVQYIMYVLSISNEIRTSNFLSFLLSTVQSNDQRRRMTAVYFASFVSRVKCLSADSMEIVGEYVEYCRNRINTVDDRYSRVLLGCIKYISENSRITVGTEDILAEAQILPEEMSNHPFRRTGIEVFDRFIDEIDEI
ncbi:hypothetical protein NEMIN01_0308 [Nematocida minor]|uniref:uncharacterized protein n=1 Tax=Nematocida minor TaxID=1912983 RepID=UPI00221EAA03|nr:uncharacterized protein NEMIN01_0308 [Nematocida minor]KAI5189142.1 hypothetical protein NEMIN01_0308 [Nematocida minor]